MDRQRLVMSWAGNTCVAYSTMGARAQAAHHSQRALSVWRNERKVKAEAQHEDMFLQECTVLFKYEEQLRDPLASSHKIIRVQAGPETQGFPTSRPRSFTAGLSLATLVWVGPATDEQVQMEFSGLFDTTMELTGDCFFQASEAQVLSNQEERLQKQKKSFMLKKAKDQWELLLAMLPPGAGARLNAYEDIRPMYEGFGGSFLCDAEQWPGKNSGHGEPLFPCQLTHGDVVSFTMQRVALGLEHMLAQGVHVIDVGTGFESALTPLFQQMPESQLKLLSGNGWCLPCMAAFALYVWSNTVRREVPNVHRERPAALDVQAEAQAETGDSLLEDWPLDESQHLLATQSDSCSVDGEGDESIR